MEILAALALPFVIITLIMANRKSNKDNKAYREEFKIKIENDVKLLNVKLKSLKPELDQKLLVLNGAMQVLLEECGSDKYLEFSFNFHMLKAKVDLYSAKNFKKSVFQQPYENIEKIMVNDLKETFNYIQSMTEEIEKIIQEKRDEESYMLKAKEAFLNKN